MHPTFIFEQGLVGLLLCLLACLLIVFITLDLVGEWRVGLSWEEGQFSGAYHLGYPGGADC